MSPQKLREKGIIPAATVVQFSWDNVKNYYLLIKGNSAVIL